MSVQLVLYPQDYDGYAFSSTPVQNEYANDPQFNISAGIQSTGLGQAWSWDYDLVTLYGQNFNPNMHWQGYYSPVCGPPLGCTWNAVSAPTMSGGVVTLYSASGVSSNGNSICGIWQTVTGLISGADYYVEINHGIVTPGSDGYFKMGGNTLTNTIGDGQLFTVGNDAIARTKVYFTANNSSMELMIGYWHDTNDDLRVFSVHVTENPATTPQLIHDINDGQVICDLYEQESVPLTLSVDEFSKIAEKRQSYSKDFDLPNTKRNNKIFTHVFEITKVIETNYDFNPYAQTRAVLKEDGVILFDGFLKLIAIKDQEGEISYNVNLFSQTITLKEALEGRKFKDLDFSELEHEYKRTSITQSWDDGVGLPLTNPITSDSFAYDGSLASPTDHTNVLKYPYVNYKGDMVIATGNNNNANVGMPELLSLGEVFRPWIQIEYILKKIFQGVGFEYTSVFLTTPAFTKLFMDFSWGTGEMPSTLSEASWAARGPISDVPIGTSWTALQLRDGNTTPLPSAYTTGGTVPYSFTCTADNTNFTCDFAIALTGTGIGGATASCQWAVYNTSTGNPTGVTYEFQTGSVGAFSFTYYTGVLNVMLNNGESIRPEAICGNATLVEQKNEDDVDAQYSLLIGYMSANSIGQSFLLGTTRGDIGQWEFVESLIKMFNLVTLPDPNDNTSMLIEPYNSVFGVDNTSLVVNPAILDWTDKVDMSDVTINPLNLNREALFKYKEDDGDHNLLIFKEATANMLYPGFYGCHPVNMDGLLGLNGNMVTLLEGKEEVEASPFSSTVCRDYLPGFPELIVPQICGGDRSGNDLDYFANVPRILYNCGEKDLANMTYYIPENFGDSSTDMDAYLQFNHCSEIDSNFQVPVTAYDVNFGACQTTGFFNLTPKNLYNEYYAEYFVQLHNRNTRLMKVKIKLNSSDINTFRFYDIVRIKNKNYRVNNINYNPGELSVVELIALEFEPTPRDN